ncbi:hypothetical protein NUW54_g7838 [Trametes sanguinea]|uniref:Uncharacterized protein n=1 Tax=Trametes sanguinea TaxID=158606 RepID=A0ACC1PK31_9APHY|nr:hypothetical protein NUW54_g7838 [Trametes sanguinea]
MFTSTLPALRRAPLVFGRGLSTSSSLKLAKAQASGDDTSDIESKISEEQTKLNTNIATDQAHAGDPSKGVA